MTSRPLSQSRFPRLLSAVGYVGLALVLCGCPREEAPIRVSVRNTAPVASLDPEKVAAQARAEGELSWYTSTPEREAQAILDAFSRRYPFIRTRLTRGGSFAIADQVRGQIASGRMEADVLHVLDPSTFVQLRNQGSLLYYDSPESHAYPPDYRDPGYWTALRAVTMCMAYDPRHLPPGRAPTTWESLTAASWEGRLGLKDASTAGAGYGFYFLLRERYGTLFWEKIARLHPTLYGTEAEMLEALDRGQVDVVAGLLGYAAYGALKRGQSLRLVWPKEGIPLVIGPVAILTGAPHPNCARLFVDFVLSAEGQKVVVESMQTYSVRPGVAPPAGRPALSSLNLLVPTAGWADFAAKHDLLERESADLLGAGGE